jgi:hypothetical protein
VPGRSHYDTGENIGGQTYIASLEGRSDVRLLPYISRTPVGAHSGSEVSTHWAQSDSFVSFQTMEDHMATEVIEKAVLKLCLRGLNATAALILFWSFAEGIALVPATASAQADDAATAEVKALEVTPEDYAAARSLSSWCYHTMPGRTPAAKRFSQDGPSTELPGNLFELETSDLPSYQPPSLPNPPTPSFYPDELFNIGLLVSGTTPGPTIVSAQLHPIYLSALNVSGAGRCATGSCWGNPKQFLTDFGPSTFSHILDQYVGSSALNRYTLGTQFSASQLRR